MSVDKNINYEHMDKASYMDLWEEAIEWKEDMQHAEKIYQSFNKILEERRQEFDKVIDLKVIPELNKLKKAIDYTDRVGYKLIKKNFEPYMKGVKINLESIEKRYGGIMRRDIREVLVNGEKK